MTSKVSGYILSHLRQKARLSPEDCAALCGCSLQTWNRWASTKGPRYAELLLQVVGCGDLSCIDPLWQGWRLFKGTLYDPVDSAYLPNNILSMHFGWQQIRELKNLVRELQEQNTKLTALFNASTNEPFIQELMDKL